MYPKLVQPSSESEPNRCYGTLRAMVLGGRFEMGERLGEESLAAELGLSRTPVRAALSRLVADGFVTYSPNRGHRMKVYTAEDVREIYGCRALLESEAVRLVAERGIDETTLAVLDDVLHRMDACIHAGGLSAAELRARYLPLNHRFHATLYAACPNGHLRTLIDKLTELPPVIRNYFNFSGDEFLESHVAHERIVSAIAAREPLRASSLMREHIWVARDRMLGPRPRATAARADARTSTPSPSMPTASSSAGVSQ
ncbi:MAG: GntR family transcriptional regulator [Burkholderiaceae bacterium]|jgi:GntR family transcriptional regulator of vanillate catabolism|nr:GntR family transcriptional regulator [Burkholderiales bacterium]MCZ8338963.1 GntR family transcriptional regulator [Burkholderiaceae bacterium]